MEQRYDGTGTPHYDRKTGQRILPHVHDATADGGVRAPTEEETPK